MLSLFSLSLCSPQLKKVSSMAALFSPSLHLPSLSPSYQKSIFSYRPPLSLRLKSPTSLLAALKSFPDDGVSALDSAAASAELNVGAGEKEVVTKFEDPKWLGGTWDLKQFRRIGGSETDWDAVIDAEARRRKWLATNPETSSNDDPITFDTSIIPWWAWIKRYHLPEAELLNGRAAMVGFFMAYFVDSLTSVGLVNQMGNFFCKTLLFVAVVGVLLIRKNEDLDTLKKLLDETTFYDKQWEATWQDATPAQTSSKNEL